MNDPVKIQDEMFRPPVDHTMRVLDRSFFSKPIILSAARTFDSSQIHKLRQTLSNELLRAERVPAVKPSPLESDQPLGRKAILLRPDIRPEEPKTWTEKIHQLHAEKAIDIVPFELILRYDYWSYNDIMKAILPEDEQDEIPSGFAVVGHVAHLNLRDQYLPYKHLIAEVLIDKNPAVKTVINKVDDVGAENEYRTFRYELLKGDPSLEVEIKELDCVFRFDYSKVYWNSRLNTEHERLVKTFKPGQAVCDVMAGVGPFAVPAAKRKIFVWANDLNPDSYMAMLDARERNKVQDYLKAFNMDGREFIRKSAREILKDDHKVETKPKQRRRDRAQSGKKRAPSPGNSVVLQPKTFDHYVMNLPATATQFLDAFIDLYKGQEEIFAPHTDRELPMVHVYCFSTKSDDNKKEEAEICEELSTRLRYPMKLGHDELMIRDVRDVAPKKRMFCATFRLPKAVAFGKE